MVRVAVGPGVDASVGVGVGCGATGAWLPDATLEGVAVGGLVCAVEAGGAPEQAVNSPTTTIRTARVARGKAVTRTAIRAFSLARSMSTACGPGTFSSVR